MSDLYGFAQPSTTDQFRLRTESHRSMAGVTYPTFTCVKCGRSKHTTGSRWVDGKTRKGGRLCSECAPAVVVVPPVACGAQVNGVVPPVEKNTATGHKTLLTDAQVLECRAAYEFDGIKPVALVRKYGVTATYMRRLLDYAVRSKLIPEQHRTRSA